MSQATVYAPANTVQVIVPASVPAYPADATVVIQAAMSGLAPGLGGNVFLTHGKYKAGGLTSVIQGLDLSGEGMPGLDAATDTGSTQICVPDGVTGITLGLASTHQTRGYGLRRLHFIGDGPLGNGKGAVILGAENCILQDLSISDFPAGTGLTIDGNPGGNAQYIVANNLRIANCLVGLYLDHAANGLRLTNGYFAGYPPLAVTPSARRGTGLLLNSGDTLMVTDTVFQTWATCINIRNHVGHKIDARFENFGVAVRVAGTCKGAYITGCFNNGSTAVYVEAGARNIKFAPRWLEGDVVTPFFVEQPHPTVQMIYP